MTFTTPLPVLGPAGADPRMLRPQGQTAARPAGPATFADQLQAARQRLDSGQPNPAAAPPTPASPAPMAQAALIDPRLATENLGGDAASALSRIKFLFEQAALEAAREGSAGPGTRPGPGVRFRPGDTGLDEIGGLSARFESGSKGIEAIGYDEVGGTSYGKFQISSRAGSMDRFLDYLKGKAPAWAERLRDAGPANTRSTSGAMPAEWKKIAAENPRRFEELQNGFIKDTYFAPAAERVLERTGVDVKALPPALKEVLWSTAVQHGPAGAADIFSRAIARLPEGQAKEYARDLVQEVYAGRRTQFGSSTEAVQAGVKARLAEEKNLALGLLEGAA